MNYSNWLTALIIYTLFILFDNKYKKSINVNQEK